MLKCKIPAFLFLACTLCAQPARDEMFTRTLTLPRLVKGGEVEAHWMEDGNTFWFAQDGPGGAEAWRYDPVASKKAPLVDLPRLREALARLVGYRPSLDRLPFDSFSFLPGEGSARLTANGREFLLQLKSYAIEA